jgi:hypothetical protein
LGKKKTKKLPSAKPNSIPESLSSTILLHSFLSLDSNLLPWLGEGQSVPAGRFSKIFGFNGEKVGLNPERRGKVISVREELFILAVERRIDFSKIFMNNPFYVLRLVGFRAARGKGSKWVTHSKRICRKCRHYIIWPQNAL